MEVMEVTPKERELIEAIRYYHNSRPNPSKMLRLMARQLFESLLKERN